MTAGPSAYILQCDSGPACVEAAKTPPGRLPLPAMIEVPAYNPSQARRVAARSDWTAHYDPDRGEVRDLCPACSITQEPRCPAAG